MLPDLQYPADAIRLLDNLNNSLEYDAAMAALGNRIKEIPQKPGTPNLTTGVRFGGEEADKAVIRDAPMLFARFFLISLVSRFEFYIRNLLLQREYLSAISEKSAREKTKAVETRIKGVEMWKVLKSVSTKMRSRNSIAEKINKFIIIAPTGELEKQLEMLVGLFKVRNCFVHNQGVVQMEDVKIPGSDLGLVKDTDTLKAEWVELIPTVNGKEIILPYTNNTGAEAKLVMVKKVRAREWKIGDTILLTPSECQNISLSIRTLAGAILKEFIFEMNQLLVPPIDKIA